MKIDLVFAKFVVLHHCYPKAGFDRQAAIRMLSDVYPYAMKGDVEYAIRWAHSWTKGVSSLGVCVLCDKEEIEGIICSDCDTKFSMFIEVMK